MSQGSYVRCRKTTASVIPSLAFYSLTRGKFRLDSGIEATSSYQQKGYNHIAKPIDPNRFYDTIQLFNCIHTVLTYYRYNRGTTAD